MTQYRRYGQILLVAEDPAFARFATRCVASSELAVKRVRTIDDAMAGVKKSVPDLIISVSSSAEASCLQACERVREITRVPLLVMCADGASDHIAQVLVSGADDHVPRTVTEKELQARVRSLLRRNQLSTYSEPDEITAGPIRLDCYRAVCSVNGSQTALTPKQFRLLKALALQPGRILSHGQLIEQVWGSPYHASQESLRKLVQRVRKSLARVSNSEQVIVSVPRLGYYLNLDKAHDGNVSPEDAQWRKHVLEATRRCLSAKGFHDVTISDICRTSFTPRSVLYRYFRNKDELLNETVQESSRQNLALLSSLTRDAGPSPGSVHRLIGLMIPLFSAPAFFDIGRFNIEWWAWAIRNESTLRGFRETWSEWREGLAAVIRAEVGEEASDETVRAMASLMLSIYNGLILHATLEGDELDMEAIMRLQQFGWEGILERVRSEGQAQPARKGRRRSRE